MAITDKLTAIANEIRNANGLTDSLTLDQMVIDISAMPKDLGQVDSYVKTEAKRVAKVVSGLQNDNTISFIAMSDPHMLATNAQAMTSLKHAVQGGRIIKETIPIDFSVILGDMAFGANNDTTDVQMRDLKAMRQLTSILNPDIVLQGNHDLGRPSMVVSAETFYSYYGRFNKNVVRHSGNEDRGYCYFDIEDKKVRVICLNTSDRKGGISEDCYMSGTQLQWFANSLDLSSKSNSAKWGIIILSHHPLDWGDIIPAASFLKAYVDGTSYSTTHNGVSVSYNYSGKNSATVIAQFHGHVHGFRVDNIHYKSGSSVVATDVKRLAIPNAYPYRNNEYGTNDVTENNGIEFGQPGVTYNKTMNTGKDTAFCVVTIDLNTKNIHATCYGAGEDRHNITYGTGAVKSYNITKNLTNAYLTDVYVDGSSTNSDIGTITEGSKYKATIAANSGYALNSVSVSMGGSPVSISNNTFEIASVTGDIVITATATNTVSYNVRNLVLEAEEQNSTALYNGTGYKNGYYLSSNGGESVDSSCVATGYIQYNWTKGDAIYIRGATVSTNSHVRIYGYVGKVTTPTSAAMCTGSNIDTYFTLEYPEGTGVDYYKLTVKDTKVPTYIRISVIGTGENLIVTINEPIVEGSSGGGVSPEPETPVTYSVTNNLTNASNGNTATTVTKGSSYSATITANSGYELSSITVTMGGTNVTSSVVSGSTITISNVTGNIVITATAVIVENPEIGAYINLVPTAIADSSGVIYNAPYGYKDGYYLSSGTVNSFSTDADCVATGSIYIDTDVEAIYVKGATWDTTNSHVRFLAGAAVGGISYLTYANGTGANPIGTLLTLETLGDNYYKFTLTADGKANLRGKYYRFSLKGTGANLIITHDQPIT